MTTIAYKDGVLASDSFLVGGDGKIASTCYEKIWEHNGVIYGFSGYSKVIDDFKAIVRMPGSNSDRLIDIFNEGENLYWIEINSTGVSYEGCVNKSGNISKFELHGPHAIGSGGEIAKGAMMAGATAEEAVYIAGQIDVYTGGEIRTHTIGR